MTKRFLRLVFALFTTGAVFCCVPPALSARLSTEAEPAAAAAPGWVAAQASKNVAYFAFAAPSPRIERFNMQQRTWMAPIALTAVPTALAVDGTGIYVSLGTKTERIALDGSSSTPLIKTPQPVSESVIGGTFLYLQSADSYSGARFISVDKTTGIIASGSNEYFYPMHGLSYSGLQRQIFGRDSGLSPADIIRLQVTSVGKLGEQYDSPYHGDYPDATRTFVFPDQTLVADNAGIVYSTSDLTYVNSLNGAFIDLAFYGKAPVVLRDGMLIAYSNAFLETGRTAVAGKPLRIFIYGDSVYCFANATSRGVAASRVAVRTLHPQEPGDPVDPNGLQYTPDAIELGNGGIVYLLHAGTSSVFRWSIAEQRYLETIPLLEVPKFMAYSDSSNALYIAYPSGKITTIRLNESFAEKPFANTPLSPLGLSVAGDFVFACDGSGAWATHYTFSRAGEVISAVEWNYYSKEYVWSPRNHRMYFFRDDTSPNDLIWEEIDFTGNIGQETDSPYHGEYAFYHPIRVSPAGSEVVTGSGDIYNAVTLKHLAKLSNVVTDAAWLGADLFTTRAVAGYTQVQKWTAAHTLKKTVQYAGEPLRLLSTGSSMLAIVEVDGMPTFKLFDTDLQPRLQEPPPMPRLANISTRAAVDVGDKAAVAGFIVTGTGSKKVMIRGVGPSLAQANVANPLQDPTLELFDRTGASISINNDWRDTQQTEIQATGIAPTDEREPAIIAVLSSGFYTAVLRGGDNWVGVGLIEVYDLNSDGGSELANISTRSFVASGDNVMIGGFIIGSGGVAQRNVIVRAIGPSLQSAIPDALADPVLELHDGNGVKLATNDDWGNGDAEKINATGIPPNDSRESAIVASLPPGNYTAVIRGKGAATGVALVEVYELP